MFELAKRFGDGPILMGTIAKEQELSRKYLHALLTTLKSRGLVESSRGVKGGYHLARNPSEIPLIDIVEALEGPLALVHCARDKESCARSGDCVVQGLWEELSLTLSEKLAQVTLADLLERDKSIH